MAKMTMHGVTYEGTPEELREVVRTFEVAAVEAKPEYLTVKREAKAGERVLITNAQLSGGKYKDGDVRMVTAEHDSGVFVTEHSIGLLHREYEVIVEPTQAKAPADKLSHNGADYTLVDRKAQAGDVVIATAESSSCWVRKGTPYEVTESRSGRTEVEGYGVYTTQYNRTEANVLVYEKVAEEAPKEYPQEGDIVRATCDYFDFVEEGDLGVVIRADGTNRPFTRFDREDPLYAHVEIVARAKDRVDVA